MNRNKTSSNDAKIQTSSESIPEYPQKSLFKQKNQKKNKLEIDFEHLFAQVKISPSTQAPPYLKNRILNRLKQERNQPSLSSNVLWLFYIHQKLSGSYGLVLSILCILVLQIIFWKIYDDTLEKVTMLEQERNVLIQNERNAAQYQLAQETKINALLEDIKDLNLIIAQLESQRNIDLQADKPSLDEEKHGVQNALDQVFSSPDMGTEISHTESDDQIRLYDPHLPASPLNPPLTSPAK